MDIAAERPTVWAFLLDPERLASCVPGTEEVRQLDESTFEGTIAAAVGPIKGRFWFTTRITEAEPPRRLVAEVDGRDSVTGSRVTATVVAELGEDQGVTTFSYDATVTTHGRLAIVGDMILRATANLMFEQFARCLRDRLSTVQVAP